MIANMNEKGRQVKLLAAIAVLAMVVCAFAVAMPSADAATGYSVNPAVEPSTGYTAITGNKDVSTAADIEKLADANGVIFVGQAGATITLKENITGPVNVSFVLEGNLTITSETGENNSLTISSDRIVGKMVDGTTGYSSVVLFNLAGETGAKFSIVNANVTLDNKSTTSITCSLFNNQYPVEGGYNGTVAIQNSTVTFTQTGTAVKVGSYNGTGSSWLGATVNKSYLNITDSTVNFNGTAAFMDTVIKANNADIRMTDVAVGLVVAAGSDIKDSTYTVSGSDNQGIDFKGTSTVSGTTISITDAGKTNSEAKDRPDVMLYAGAKVTFTDSTLSADNIRVVDAWNGLVTATGKTAEIAGGVIDADIDAPITAVGTTSEGTVTLGGVTLKDSTVAKDVTVSVSTGGIITEGNVDMSAATISNGSNNNIIVASGETKLPASTQNVYVANGTATAGETPVTAGEIPVTDTASFAAAASVQNAEITIAKGFPLTAPVALESGVAVTVTSGYMTVTADNTISATNATFNGGVTGNSMNAKVNLAGTYTIKAGSIDVNGSISGSITGEGKAVVKITGIIDGDLEISGAGTVEFTDVTVSPNADVTLGDGITYNINNKFYLYGALLVTTPYTGAGITMNVYSNGEFKAFPNATISPSIAVAAVNGATNVTIDLGEAMGIQYIRQDVTSNLNYSQTQTVIIEESIFIKKGATLTVLGQLIVNENVDVIIEEGGRLVVNNQTAKVTINGDIEVENGGSLLVTDADTVDISGTVTSDGTLTVNSNVTVKEGGSILVQNGDKSVFAVSGKGAKLVIDAGGNVEIRGQANVSDITNKGTVTLNGAVLSGNVKISMAADGAVVDIKSFTSGKNASNLEITDYGLIFKDNKEPTADIAVGAGDYTKKANTLTVDKESYGGIRGLVISESVTSVTKNKVTTYYNSFVLSGSIGIADESIDAKDEVASRIVKINGPSIDVNDTLTIAKAVTLELTSGNLDVAGTITATAENATVKASGGDINVTGMIDTCKEITDNINAFSYKGTLDGETEYFYTTLKTAIDNGQTDIEALGTTSVLESVDIPAETTVKAGKTHEKITIGSTGARDVVVTVKDGGEIRSCIIDVMGTLTFDNKRDDRGNTITSDVYVEDDVSKSYTNIYTALNNAQSGETVTIYRSGSNVVLDKDVTIKTGVTLDIPSGKGVTVNDTVTVTVDGILKLSGNLVAQNVGFNPKADNHSTIDVNGAFMAVGEIVYADDVVSTVDYYIPGAYYNLVNTSGNWNYVTPIEQAAAVSNDVTGGEIEIWGENQVGDVAFTGDEDVEVTIDLYGKLNASNLKLTYSTFNVGAGYQFDGTVSSDAGSVQIVNASNFVVGSTVDEDAATIMSISGTPTQVDDKGADAKVTVATGNVSVLNANADGNDFVVTGVEFAISEGATLTVAESNAVLYANELAVNGTLVATNGGKVVADKVYIIGTFTVAVADNDNGILAGSADVKEVRVGLSSNFKTTSAATLNAEKLNGWTAIYVSAESTVTEKLIENAASTQFFVEDELWFTVYGNGSSIEAKAPGVVPTENVLLDKWTGKDVNHTTITIEAEATDKSFTIGQVERFDADIDYDIYTVTVFADPGISAVYIDGKLMTSGVFRNDVNGMWAEGFQLSVAAGTHEITYKLGNYFSGEATMTVNGETVTGNTFTTSGTGTEDMKVTVYLQGIEASAPETPSTGSSDDGMGLTDYLLIILVVLIVIMAIMVAMRLMRS